MAKQECQSRFGATSTTGDEERTLAPERVGFRYPYAARRAARRNDVTGSPEKQMKTMTSVLQSGEDGASRYEHSGYARWALGRECYGHITSLRACDEQPDSFPIMDVNPNGVPSVCVGSNDLN